MRYINVPTVSFTDSDGNQRAVKDMREIPAYVDGRTLTRLQDEAFDAIAARPDVYGDGGEMQAYKIWEANMASCVDAVWNLATVRKVFVPV